MRTLLLIWVLFLFGCAAPDPSVESATPAPDGEPTDVAGETNVNPDINRGYKSPELDVERWAERFTGESREVFSARFEVLAALGLEPGDRIADIGAGTGLYVQLFAQSVGPNGKVYAVDIAGPFLKFIEESAAADGLTNVTTVLGKDKTSNLPDGSVDVVFHSDVYHHFEFPLTMNQDLARALTDGGELFVLDFERIPGITREWTLNHVRAGKEVVRTEIESSGFTFVEEVELPGLEENYLLRFRKAL